MKAVKLRRNVTVKKKIQKKFSQRIQERTLVVKTPVNFRKKSQRFCPSKKYH
jgi:hypothetical protein